MRFEIRYPSHREELSSDSDFVVFGRDPSCDFVIKDPRCSRRHASLRVVPEGFNLLDMGSSNGLYVFGQRVDDAVVSDGDVFSMGDVFVRILPEDMPQTLAQRARNDSTVVLPPREAPPPRLDPPAAPAPRADPVAPIVVAPPVSFRPQSPIAGKVLGGSSVVLGLCLLIGPPTLTPHLGFMAYALAALGVFSGVAGVGLLRGLRWARNAHFVLFAIWTLTCLLTPFGVVGLAYQLQGEDRPATDPFFALVIGVAAVLATVAMVVAVLAARLYIPAPLPL